MKIVLVLFLTILFANADQIVTKFTTNQVKTSQLQIEINDSGDINETLLFINFSAPSNYNFIFTDGVITSQEEDDIFKHLTNHIPIEISGNIISTATGDIILSNSDVTGEIRVQLGTTTSATHFGIHDSTGASLVDFFGDGRVGIGTNNPLVKLHVVGDSGTIESRIENISTSVTDIAAIRLTTGVSTNLWQAFARNGDFFIGIHTIDDYLTIKDGGNVGIGNSIPSATFDVTGTVKISDDFTLANNLIFADVGNGTVTMGNSVTGTDRFNVFGAGSGVQQGIVTFYDSSAANNIKFRFRDQWTASSIPPRLETESSLGLAFNTTTNAPFVWYINGTGNEKMRLTSTKLLFATPIIISNVQYPILTNHAANKEYVDAATNALLSGDIDISGLYFIDSVRILTNQQSAISNPTNTTADVTFSQNEVDLINSLRATIVSLQDALRQHGLIAE